MTNLVVYYSSNTGYTERFVNKLGIPSVKIPVSSKEDMPVVSEPYVLIIPTYGGGVHVDKSQGAVNALYSLPEGWTPPDGWNVRIRETTGQIIVEAPKYYRDGDTMNIPIVLKQPKDYMEPLLPQIYRFLDHKDNATWMRGVISSGNKNFGEDYGVAADKVSDLYGVPSLYRFELLGTDEDVKIVRDGILNLDGALEDKKNQ